MAEWHNDPTQGAAGCAPGPAARPAVPPTRQSAAVSRVAGEAGIPLATFPRRSSNHLCHRRRSRYPLCHRRRSSYPPPGAFRRGSRCPVRHRRRSTYPLPPPLEAKEVSSPSTVGSGGFPTATMAEQVIPSATDPLHSRTLQAMQHFVSNGVPTCCESSCQCEDITMLYSQADSVTCGVRHNGNAGRTRIYESYRYHYTDVLSTW